METKLKVKEEQNRIENGNQGQGRTELEAEIGNQERRDKDMEQIWKGETKIWNN